MSRMTWAPQGHYLLGLRILNMLVAEFNQPILIGYIAKGRGRRRGTTCWACAS